jgi:NTE family protein
MGRIPSTSGYPTGALVGERLLSDASYTRYKLAEQRLFEGRIRGRIAGSRAHGPAARSGSPTGLLKSAAAFVAVDTPVGPLYLGYGWAADGSRSGYLYLGRP